MSCNRPLPAGMQRCCVGCDTARTKAGNVLWEHWDHRWVERPSLATVLRLRSRLQKRARVVPADMRDAGPSGVGSSATSQQASTSGRSAPKKRLGRIAQPSISAGEPQQDRARAIDSMAGQIAAAHPSRGGTASLRRSGCITRGDRFRSSRGFSGATPPWSRRARRRRDRRYIRCRSRVAPPTSLRPNPYRSAALHRAARRAARRHGGPAEPPVGVPGYGSGPLSRAFSGTHAQFRYWAGNSSKQAGACIFGVVASMTRSTTWVMEMRFVTRCTATASLR